MRALLTLANGDTVDAVPVKEIAGSRIEPLSRVQKRAEGAPADAGALGADIPGYYLERHDRYCFRLS